MARKRVGKINAGQDGTKPLSLREVSELPTAKRRATISLRWLMILAFGGLLVVAATTGGDDRLPMGDLERTSTADWTSL